MRETEIVYGPPGTGKTEYLLRTLERYLSSGYAPEDIAFVSFSRRAVQEAVSRARTAFPQYSPDSFVHFRTIHSTAYHLTGLSREDVFQPKHLEIFGELAGLDFKSGPNQEGYPWEGTVGDKCLTLIHNAKNRATTLREEWQRANLDNLSWPVLNHVATKYEDFKKKNFLVDFCDMIEMAQDRTLSAKVLIVDEAQDTNTAQWNLLRAVSKEATSIHIAGDDDQSIYGWSGANADMLWRLRGTRTVLPVSHRLPQSVKELADRLTSRMAVRVPKQYRARPDLGNIQYIPNVDYIDLRDGGTWLLIARNNYQLEPLRELARQQGVVYSTEDGRWSWSLPPVRAALAYERLRRGQQITKAEAKNLVRFVARHPVHIDTLPDVVVWTNLFSTGDERPNWMQGLTAMSASDREYIRALRKTNESLTEPGRVRIGTAHSVKGAQADRVAIVTDIGARVAQGAVADPDAELRVQYVAATRARHELFIVDPQTRYFWSFN